MWSDIKSFLGPLIVILVVVALMVVGVFYLVREQCTPEREGVIYHHGQGGGLDYRCHDSKWQTLRGE